MKTAMIKIMSMVILGIIISNFAMAGTPKPEKIDNIIKKEISYPDFAKTQKLEGVVLVNFTVNTDGTITVNLTNESNVSLKNYVVSKLQSLKVKSVKSSYGKTYKVKFENIEGNKGKMFFT